MEPALLEFFAQEGGVDEVAVVADGNLAARGIDHERLRIREIARAGGRIAHMPHGARAFQSLQIARR